MDEQAAVSRRLSRRDSKSTSARSLWHSKSTKKPTESPTATATQVKHLSSLASTHSMDQNDDNDGTRGSQENVTSSILARSIIPDPLGELPAWFKKESDMAAANVSTFRIKYPLHNPNGPRWYKNHHLLPPSSNRPPSLFSPSFPPMATSVQGMHDRSEDPTRLPGPSRTPSGTPLPTPSSSQVRIPDPSTKPRSRKTSQDNVDLMDVSDPWGTHWHHESPYDAGSSNISPVSVDSPEGLPRTRSRLSSMNAGQARRKTVTPSPLSQSTSALPLQTPDSAHVSRKLSKRRKPVLAGLFSTHGDGAPEGPESPPVEDSSSSLPKRLSAVPSGALNFNFTGSKRFSTLSPMSMSANGSTAALSSHSSSKHDKRQSVLGRLMRKFSILRRPNQDPATTINEGPEGTSEGAALSAVEEQASRHSVLSQRQPSPEKPVTEKKASDPSKRIPPPRVDLDMELQGGNVGVEREGSDRASSISYDVPFSPLGKLTITNPDAPGSGSGSTTPVGMNNALPPEAPSEPPSEPRYPTRDVPTTIHLHSTDRQRLAKPSSVPSSAGRSSPIPGLLSPISVAVPAVSLPEVLLFMTTAQSPVPPISIPPSSPPPGLRLSTSAPVQAFTPTHTTGDVSSGSSSSPVKEVPRPIPPHLVFPVADDSPLSKASVLVNPPTPYNTDEPYPGLPVFERVPTDRSSVNRQSQVSFSKQASPTKDADDQQVDSEVRLTKSNSTSRKTETYKLVRTHSDKVSTSSEAAFQAEGEQWLLVNSTEVPRRRRTRDRAEKTEKIEKPSSRISRVRERERDREKERGKDREREREKERERDRDRERDRERERGREEERERRRRQEKVSQQGNEDQRRTASHARVKVPIDDKTDSGSLSGRPGRARSLDTPQRPTLVQPLIFTLQDEPPRSRKSDDRPRDSTHQPSKTARPGRSPIVAVARVDRLPSTSARPTSELTSAADMNALKAREAWEMDRLWKGRSMVQGQPETSMIASASSTEFKTANNEAARDAFSVQSFAHGSSHTSYVVQPLQAHPIPASVFYANMPSAPPPIIYAATSPYGQPHASSSRDHTTYRSLPNSFTFPSKDSSVDVSARLNPLPAPPRESGYQPSHLPVLADRSSGSASEYWGKYTNMSPHS